MNCNHLKYGVGVEFTAYDSEIMKEGALTLFTLCYAYRSFALLAHMKSRIEYLMPSDNIIVLD